MKKRYTVIACLFVLIVILGSYSTRANISENIKNQQYSVMSIETKKGKENKFDLNSIVGYSGEPYSIVNNNIPYFNKSDYKTKSFKKYSKLDTLGRCGVAFANIGIDIMSNTKREAIGMIKPSGWHTVKYDNVDGKYLYNRCHLIAFSLSGDNANKKNLITGTRYMNTVGMSQFENKVANYVRGTKNHVLYRVTPIFEGDNLLATGVLMEGFSVEDNGRGICFNVFCYNEQPGIVIDHSNGDSKALYWEPEEEKDTNEVLYIANKNSKKFHYPSCESVAKMKEKNKEYMKFNREEVILRGYVPCKICNP